MSKSAYILAGIIALILVVGGVYFSRDIASEAGTGTPGSEEPEGEVAVEAENSGKKVDSAKFTAIAGQKIFADDPDFLELQGYLDDLDEENAIACAKKLMYSPKIACRLKAIEAFRWFGGNDNLEPLARMAGDSASAVAGEARDAFAITFRSLDEKPGQKSMDCLQDVILGIEESVDQEPMFALLAPLDPEVSLPMLFSLKEKAEDNEELLERIQEAVDFATEIDGGIDTLDKANDWLAKRQKTLAGTNRDNE